MDKKTNKNKEKEKKEPKGSKRTAQKIVKKVKGDKVKTAAAKRPKKKETVKKKAPQKIEKETKKKDSEEKELEDFAITKTKKYFEAVGRRKTSRARVRLYTQGEKKIEVNGKPYNSYFETLELQKIVESPLEAIKASSKFKVTASLKGGGSHSQAEALRHGVARALCLLNPYFKKKLRKAGFLTRDPRVRERKKFGLKRARRAPQWSKR